MAMPTNTFWFRPGRLERSGRKSPGILAVDDKYEFTVHKCSKDGTEWNYNCKYRLTPKVKCQAKAKVLLFNDKWVLKHVHSGHNCEPNRPRVIAELLRHKMKIIVRGDPVQPVGKAVRKVRVEAADMYGAGPSDRCFFKLID